MSHRELSVSCSCGAARHTFSVPISSLPLPAYLCSCDISRRISGSLLTSYINITHEPDLQNPDLVPAQNPDISALTPYQSSTILTRWFCSTCGTHMYLQYHDDNHFEVATGTLTEENTDDIVQFNGCMWIDDTKDGGASQFISQINGRQLNRYAQNAAESEEVPLDLRVTAPVPRNHPAQVAEARSVYAHCHCRGVEFWITTPDNTSGDAKSPYPDLTIPHYLKQSENPQNVAWWLDHGRYLAGTCTCHSCRRASGFDITFWAFIPVSNIYLNAELTESYPSTSFSSSWGTMKSYESSLGIVRKFCSKCGANVFWSGDKEHTGREGLLDVAVGLLDAESGARAEELLSWWPERVSFEEDAVHRGLVQGLKLGLRDWAQDRNQTNEHAE